MPNQRRLRPARPEESVRPWRKGRRPLATKGACETPRQLKEGLRSGPADMRSGPSLLRAPSAPRPRGFSLAWCTMTIAQHQPPEPLPTRYPGRGGEEVSLEVGPCCQQGVEEGGVAVSSWTGARAQPVPGRWGAHPLPTFLPHSVHHHPPPQLWFPGSRLQGGPLARPPAAAPSPYKPWPQSALPPALPACGDSLLAPALPFPPSVRNRYRQTVRTTRGSRDSARTLPPHCLPRLPHPTSSLSPSSRSSLPFCLSPSFPTHEDIDKWESGGEEAQSATTSTDLKPPHSTATHLSSSLAFPVLKELESCGIVASVSPSLQLVQ